MSERKRTLLSSASAEAFRIRRVKRKEMEFVSMRMFRIFPDLFGELQGLPSELIKALDVKSEEERTRAVDRFILENYEPSEKVTIH